ncbi:hypothetical protein [Stakelama saccharophila]|uniref:Uncharacterized protein n=1 Tax=Stakelama saccharophila TaxID=3075605 RepID=A0ABZ0BBP5_9SPHN|nr:hypothetical protein [Stakelama sp. W311]WNO54675.1 hypothetical protein RPR59_05335 [Stakelama sp. W311]
MTLRFLPFLLVSAAPHGTLAAAQENGGRADILRDVVACRNISAESGRLACYDRAVERLDRAERAHDVVVLDREQIEARRRANFGLADKPDLAARAGEADLDRIETVVRGIGSDANGKLTFSTDAGGRWVQIDNRPSFAVENGMKVVIKKAMFGSYFADFDGATPLRVKRRD